MAKLEKIVIDGHEVVGSVEFIRSLLGFNNVSSRTKSNDVKTSNVKTSNEDTGDIKVNELPFEEDLKPSKPKKFNGSKSKSGSFEKFIKDCMEGKKIYPDDNDIVWKSEIQHLKGIGYIAVLDNFIKKDSFGVMVGSVQHYGGKQYAKNGFAFPTKKECQEFMKQFKTVSGKLRLQWNIVNLNAN